jgi:hypothetical protein
VLFGVRPLRNPDAVERGAAEFVSLHADVDDCRILAEAEDIGFVNLLTFDNDFVKHLASRTWLNLTRPAQVLGDPSRFRRERRRRYRRWVTHWQTKCGGVGDR